MARNRREALTPCGEGRIRPAWADGCCACGRTPDASAEVEYDLVELFRLRAAEHGRGYAQRRWILDALSVRRPARPKRPRVRKKNPMHVLWQDLRADVRYAPARRASRLNPVTALRQE